MVTPRSRKHSARWTAAPSSEIRKVVGSCVQRGETASTDPP